MKAQKVFRSLGVVFAGFILFFVCSLIVTAVAEAEASVILYLEAQKAGVSLNVDKLVTELLLVNYDMQLLITFFGDMLVLIVILGVAFAFSNIGNKITVTERLSVHRIPWSSVPLLILGGITLNALIIVLMECLPIPEELLTEYAEHTAGLDEYTFWAVVAVTVAAPLTEEFLCRGVFLKQFRDFLPAWLATVLSSVIFGIMHGNLVQFCYTAVTALALGWIFCLYDSVWASVLVHFGFNAASYLFTPLTTFIESFFDESEEATALCNTAEFFVFGVIALLCIPTVVGIYLIGKKRKNAAVSSEVAAL